MTTLNATPKHYGSIDHGDDNVPFEKKQTLELDETSSFSTGNNTDLRRFCESAIVKFMFLGIASYVATTRFLHWQLPVSSSATSPEYHQSSSLSSMSEAWFLRKRRPNRETISSATTTKATIPFDYVDRAEYGSVPAKDIVDPNLFDPSLRGTDDGSFLKVPFPSGAFWTNFVLRESTAGLDFSYPIMAYPYAYKWGSAKMQISYPPLRRMMDELSIRDIFNPNLSVSVVEKVQDRHVMGWDPLSVTLRYTTTASSSSSGNSNEGGYWETALVQGSPYMTISYQDVTPIVTALSIFKEFKCFPNDGKDVCSIENKDQSQITLKGTRFVIRTNENLIWTLFSSEPTSLTFDNIHKNTITSTSKFTGVLRLALAPPAQEQLKSLGSQSSRNYNSIEDVTSSSGLSRLACHANSYPVGGKTTWDFHSKKDVATVYFEYDVKTMGSSSKGCKDSTELLMLALPHHAQVLNPKQMLQTKDEFDLTFYTIKGAMVPVRGNTWSYDEPLTTTGFESKSSLKRAVSLPERTKKTIMNQVKKDMYINLPTLDENVYGYGKQVARLAQLAHISGVLLDNADGEKKLSSVTIEICQTLHKHLSAYLSGRISDTLLFDANFGGIVSKNGLVDSADDFGNGWYNDHLFHYGYIMYASAVLGKLNSTFVEEYGDAVDAIMLDVAHNAHSESSKQDANGSNVKRHLFSLFGHKTKPTSNKDENAEAFLPFTRHKSWYDSHSFASGLFPFADGKSMESSTESINCYYGSYLWSLVRWGPSSGKQKMASSKHKEDSNMVDFARLLLAMEIRGVKTYWHVANPTDGVDTQHDIDIYNPIFAKNMMVGNVGMMDVTVSTWFGTSPLYVHMINFLPITAITWEVFDPTYAEKEFHEIMEPLYNSVEKAWKGYVICDRAISDPNGAWKDALQLRSFELDSAISQSQILYFISTTDGFEAPEKSSSDNTDSEDDEDSSKLCSQHLACRELALYGYCCPAPNGAYLGCCDSKNDSELKTEKEDTTTTAKVAEDDDNDSSKLCSAHEACSALGISGKCCPTTGGAYLGCCDSSASASLTTKDSIPPPTSAPTLPLLPVKSDEKSICSGQACCSENQRCVDLGISGACCPTTGGTYLGCCDSSTSESVTTKDSIPPPTSAPTLPLLPVKSEKKSICSGQACCSENQRCVDLGISGACCPTGDGSYLGCCDSSTSESVTTKDSIPPPASAPTFSSLPVKSDEKSICSGQACCSENQRCADLGLVGHCCPVKDGAMLGCCD